MNQNGLCDDDETGEDCLHDSDGDGIVDCEDICPFGDFDGDDICDDEDDCVGTVDALGICNGHCYFDIDGDGICDTEDNCTDIEACNFNDPANGSCLELDQCDVCGGDGMSCLGCTDPTACNFDETATIDDESCLELVWAGDCGGSATEDECGVCNGPGAIYECG